MGEVKNRYPNNYLHLTFIAMSLLVFSSLSTVCIWFIVSPLIMVEFIFFLISEAFPTFFLDTYYFCVLSVIEIELH